MEIAVVIVDRLNLHSKPGGPETETGKIAKKGERFEVVDHLSRTQVDWILGRRHDGKFSWFAQRNKKTGVVFAELYEAAEPKVIAVTKRPWLWPLVVLGIGFTVIALSWLLS